MLKIQTLFLRDAAGFVVPEVNPECKEALMGGWVARQKLDGVAALLASDGTWWGRRRLGACEAVPKNFIPMHADERTGRQWGWIPVAEWSYSAQHRAALLGPVSGVPGTYELLGPDIGSGTYQERCFRLVRHREAPRIGLPRGQRLTYLLLRDFFERTLGPAGIEGVVWENPITKQLAKLKVSDFPSDRRR